MLDSPVPWEEIGRIAVKIGIAAMLIIAWRRHRAKNRTVLAEEEISLQGGRLKKTQQKRGCLHINSCCGRV